MDERASNSWANWLALTAIIVAPALLAVAIIWGASADDDVHLRSTTSAATAQTDEVRQAEPATVPGPGPSTVQQHQAMLDRMRVVVPQQMLDQMNRDVMWRQMVVGELRKIEEVQKGLDRMLAR